VDLLTDIETYSRFIDFDSAIVGVLEVQWGSVGTRTARSKRLIAANRSGAGGSSMSAAPTSSTAASNPSSAAVIELMFQTLCLTTDRKWIQIPTVDEPEFMESPALLCSSGFTPVTSLRHIRPR
jgi:hypothetical protein